MIKFFQQLTNKNETTRQVEMSPEKIRRWSEAIGATTSSHGWMVRLLGLLLMVFLSGGAEAVAQANPSSSQPNQNNNDSYPVRGAGDVRFYDYFPRFPAAACFGPQCEKNPKGKDIIENRESKKDGIVRHGKSGLVYRWPILVPECISKVPTKRDEAINENMLKTFGYPISDTQFQMIHRYDNQIMLEQMFDPEKLNWLGGTVGAAQMQDVANGAANTCRNQCASAIDFVGCSIYNFTIDESNKWNKVRNELFLPMAILLLLPGAVLAQLRVIVAAGMPIQGGDVNPFEGITRSIVAIFLIPATYLVVNYGIDLNNSITYTIYSEYQRIFGSDMYKDALCAVVRAHPVRQGHEERNAYDKPSVDKSPEEAKQKTPASDNEARAYDVKKEDPNCKGPGEAPPQRASEANSFLSTGQRTMTNASNAGLAAAWNILCAFQVVFLMYLWFVGPVVAALWVYPSAQLRGALPSWTEGVITLCFWSLFWNTTVLLMACFKGIDETGTIIQSALLFLATASVKFAFDFAGLVKAAGAEAGGMAKQAAQAAGQGAGRSPGAPGSGRGGNQTPSTPRDATTQNAGGALSGNNDVTASIGSDAGVPLQSAMGTPQGLGVGSGPESNTGVGGQGTSGDAGPNAAGPPPTAAGPLDPSKTDPNALNNANALKEGVVDPNALPPGSNLPVVPPPGMDPTRNADGSPKIDPGNVNALTGKPFTESQLSAMGLNNMSINQNGQLVGPGGAPVLGSDGKAATVASLTGGQAGATGTGTAGGVGGVGGTGGVGAAGVNANSFNLMSNGGQAGTIPPVGTQMSRQDAVMAAQTAMQNASRLDAIDGGSRSLAAANLMDQIERAPTNGQNLTMTPGLQQAMQGQQGEAAMSSVAQAQAAFSKQFAEVAGPTGSIGSLVNSPNGQVPQGASTLATQASSLYQSYNAAAASGPMTSSQLLSYNQQLSGYQAQAAQIASNPNAAGPMVDGTQARAVMDRAAGMASTDTTTFSQLASTTAGAVTPYTAPAISGGSTNWTQAATSNTGFTTATTTGYTPTPGYTSPYATTNTSYQAPAAGGSTGVPTPGAPGYVQAQADAGGTRQVQVDNTSAPAPAPGGVMQSPGGGGFTPSAPGVVSSGGPTYQGSAPAPAPSTPLPAAGGETLAYNPMRVDQPSAAPGSITSMPAGGSAPPPSPGPAPAPEYTSGGGGGYSPAPSGYSPAAPSGGTGYVSGGPAAPSYDNSPPPPAPTPGPAPNYGTTPQYTPQYNNSAPPPAQTWQAPPTPGQAPSAPQPYQSETRIDAQRAAYTPTSYDGGSPQQPSGPSAVYVGGTNNQPTHHTTYESNSGGDTSVNRYQTSAQGGGAPSPTGGGGGGGYSGPVPIAFTPTRSPNYGYVQRPTSSGSGGGYRPSGPPQGGQRPASGPAPQARPAQPGQPGQAGGGARRNNESLTDVVRNQTLRNKGNKGKKKKDELDEPPSWLV